MHLQGWRRRAGRESRHLSKYDKPSEKLIEAFKLQTAYREGGKEIALGISSTLPLSIQEHCRAQEVRRTDREDAVEETCMKAESTFLAFLLIFVGPLYLVPLATVFKALSVIYLTFVLRKPSTRIKIWV